MDCRQVGDRDGPGETRVTKGRELYSLRKALTRHPAADILIPEAASRVRTPLDSLSVEDVERLTVGLRIS